jgi:hypothetical protein
MYSDTSPFSVPCLNKMTMEVLTARWKQRKKFSNAQLIARGGD